MGREDEKKESKKETKKICFVKFGDLSIIQPQKYKQTEGGGRELDCNKSERERERERAVKTLESRQMYLEGVSVAKLVACWLGVL